MNNFSDIQDVLGCEEDNAPIEVSDDDELLHDITSRSKIYSEIIETYTNYLKNSLKCKNDFKIKASTFVIDVMTVIVLFTLSIIFISIFSEKISVEVIVSSIVSFVTAFIALPKIIISYAFNKEEEKYIAQVMKSLLSHDTSLKSIIQSKHTTDNKK